MARRATSSNGKSAEDRDLQAAIEYARQVHARDMQHRQFLKDYGSQVLRTLFLLNGGAIIATLALIGSLAEKGGRVIASPALFVPAFSAYVAGIVAAVVAMALGYFNFQYNAFSQAGPKSLADRIRGSSTEWPSGGTAVWTKRINWTAKAAVIAVVISVIAFLVGCIAMACVFKRMPIA